VKLLQLKQEPFVEPNGIKDQKLIIDL